MGGAAAAIFGGAEVAAEGAVVAEGIAAGTSVAEGLATGALTDIGGGLALDGTGALIDIGTGQALTDLGTGEFLNAATGEIFNAAGESVGMMASNAAGEAVGSAASNAVGEAVGSAASNTANTLTEIGNGVFQNASGALVDSSGQALTEVSSGIFEAPDGSFLSSTGDPLTQSATDGSFLNTNTGEIIDATGGGEQAGLNLANTGVTAEMLAKYGPLAYSVLSKVLAPATKALQTATFKTPTAIGAARPASNISATTSGNQGNTNINIADITPDFVKGNTNYSLEGGYTAPAQAQLFNTPTNPAAFSNPTPVQQQQTQVAPTGFAMGGLASGGEPEGHNPSFYSEGGLQNRYVEGEGDGTSDDVAAMLADGEFVIPADVVSDLGNGSSSAGAKILDQFLAVVREDKNDHDPHELPPDSKGPLAYLAQARKKA